MSGFIQVSIIKDITFWLAFVESFPDIVNDTIPGKPLFLSWYLVNQPPPLLVAVFQVNFGQ